MVRLTPREYVGVSSVGIGWDRVDTTCAIVIALATIFLHPVALMLNRPYWLDESWVADLTRVDWLRAMSFSSVTPVGWLALARLIPGSSLQRARLLVLGFSMASSAAAYVLARSLAWPSRRSARVAALAVAVAVSCVPIALVRNDLKPYTGDAFFALGLLVVARWVDRDQRPWSVILLGAAALVAFPFSTTSAFVSAACFGGVLGSALFARNRVRVNATLAVGAAVALGFLVVYTVTVSSHINSAVENYWRASYLSGGTIHALQQTWHRLQRLEHGFAMPAVVGIVLFVAGTVTLARMRETALAIAVPLLWIEMFVAASLRRYPFLDQRTFYFVLIPSIGVVAVGVVGLVFEFSRRVPAAGVTIAVLVAVLFGLGVAPFWQKFGVSANEDSRAQTQYVARNWGPTDIVVVSSSANWGFAYYWPHGRVVIRRNAVVANGFLAEVGDIDAVYASGRTRAAVLAALGDALDRQRHNGPRSQIFIVRSHVTGSEKGEWTHAFAVLHVHPRTICVGPEPLLIIDAATPTPATPDPAGQNAAEKIEPCPRRAP
jgi:hypothetical protein